MRKGDVVAIDARHSVDRGLLHLATRLDPIIGDRLRSELDGLPWTSVLVELDRMRGKTAKLYASTDLQSQLRMITERLGNLGFPFDDHSRQVSTLGNELRIVRNKWAHQDEFTHLDAWRTHDFAVRLLERFADAEGVAEATILRDAAFTALAEKENLAAPPKRIKDEVVVDDTTPPSAELEEDVLVTPDAGVYVRSDTASTPLIGGERHSYDPWTVVLVGAPDVVDNLRRNDTKEQVRAVATEIAEFEGPIHVDRLARLTAYSFGAQRLTRGRRRSLLHQIRQLELKIDRDGFVWPSDLDPESWDEFRPNDSTVEREFTEISPVEIANAMRFLDDRDPDMSDEELYLATLRTFGRNRRTRGCADHLEKARRLL
ncbi:DUF3320 domain-containing protein [Dietzia natronolimnaea]|uniref:DUF3320 domain-containing protein n=1 Tax=Dietzia natronolimnaea TaxID=161920 RepID=UPI0018872BD7|nr:DUF3320 domain-containing protein [Dietzia natronolimnaea]